MTTLSYIVETIVEVSAGAVKVTVPPTSPPVMVTVTTSGNTVDAVTVRGTVWVDVPGTTPRKDEQEADAELPACSAVITSSTGTQAGLRFEARTTWLATRPRKHASSLLCECSRGILTSAVNAGPGRHALSDLPCLVI